MKGSQARKKTNGLQPGGLVVVSTGDTKSGTTKNKPNLMTWGREQAHNSAKEDHTRK